MSVRTLAYTQDAIVWDIPPGKPDVNQVTAHDALASIVSYIRQQGQKGATCLYYALLPLRRRIGPMHPEGLEIDRLKERVASLWRKHLSDITPLTFISSHQEGGLTCFYMNLIHINHICLTRLGIDPVMMYIGRMKNTKFYNEGKQNIKEGLYKLATTELSRLSPIERSSFLSMCISHSLVKNYQLPISRWRPSQSKEELREVLRKHGPMSIVGMVGKSYFFTFVDRYCSYTTVTSHTLVADYKPYNINFSHSLVVIGCEDNALGTLVYFIENEKSSPSEPRRVYAIDFEIFVRKVSPYAFSLAELSSGRLKDVSTYYGVHMHPSLFSTNVSASCQNFLFFIKQIHHEPLCYASLLPPLVTLEEEVSQLKKAIEELAYGQLFSSLYAKRYQAILSVAVSVLYPAHDLSSDGESFESIRLEHLLTRSIPLLFASSESLPEQLLERELRFLEVKCAKARQDMLMCIADKERRQEFSQEDLAKQLSCLPRDVFETILFTVARHIGPSSAKKHFENRPIFGEEMVKMDVFVLRKIISNHKKMILIFPGKSLFSLQSKTEEFCNVSLLISLLSNPNTKKEHLQFVFDQLMNEIKNEIYGLVYYEAVASMTVNEAEKILKSSPFYLFSKSPEEGSIIQCVIEEYKKRFSIQNGQWQKMVEEHREKVLSLDALSLEQKQSLLTALKENAL